VTKISESTEFKIDLKTVVSIIVITASFVGMYYTLQADIAEAKTLPPTEVKRLEFDLKEEWNQKMIESLDQRVNMLEQMGNILKEEIQINSTLIKDGTEQDVRLNELNKKLETLQNQKPTVIIKDKKTWF
jgi:hypothetical protein|tara:strand:+ start:239 stop:628 length:390 start_codon:yes stop_codon:yes gene_type:complete